MIYTLPAIHDGKPFVKIPHDSVLLCLPVVGVDAAARHLRLGTLRPEEAVVRVAPGHVFVVLGPPVPVQQELELGPARGASAVARLTTKNAQLQYSVVNMVQACSIIIKYPSNILKHIMQNIMGRVGGNSTVRQ